MAFQPDLPLTGLQSLKPFSGKVVNVSMFGMVAIELVEPINTQSHVYYAYDRRTEGVLVDRHGNYHKPQKVLKVGATVAGQVFVKPEGRIEIAQFDEFTPPPRKQGMLSWLLGRNSTSELSAA